MHGGATPTGLALPQTKTGRYSKHMPTRLAGKYEDSLKDAGLLSLRDEISLLDSQLAQVLEDGNNSESGELWKKLKEALREYDSVSFSAKNYEEVRTEAFGKMRWLIKEGFQDYMARIEVRQIIQARTFVVGSERQRVEKLMEFAQSKIADALLGAMYNCVGKHVTDPETLRRIGADLRHIAAEQTGR